MKKAEKDPNYLKTRDAFLSVLPSRLQSQVKIKAVELDSFSDLISYTIKYESLEESLAFNAARNQQLKPPTSTLHCYY